MEDMGDGSIAILPAAPVRTRNRDVEYPYRQDSDFHYVTGFDEPEAAEVFRTVCCSKANSMLARWSIWAFGRAPTSLYLH